MARLPDAYSLGPMEHRRPIRNPRALTDVHHSSRAHLASLSADRTHSELARSAAEAVDQRRPYFLTSRSSTDRPRFLAKPMNKIRRVVWNAALRPWQASADLTRSHRKGGRQKVERRTIAVRATTLLLAPWSLPLAALSSDLPTGGTVTAGVGTIVRSGSTMTITQQSERMAIDWNGFSIGASATVRFVQPSSRSAVLNRVLGPDVSKIFGSLQANGQVFLMNPNGVLLGHGAQVNVGGLAAATLDIATEDFLAGEYRFAGDSTGAVINRGNVHAHDDGYVALMAARVENAGEIRADSGDVLLGAGRKVRLDLGGPVQLEIEAAALDALIEQRGAIRADGGRVLLTAKAAADLASMVINHSGIIEARRLEAGDAGEIVWSAAKSTWPARWLSRRLHRTAPKQ